MGDLIAEAMDTGSGGSTRDGMGTGEEGWAPRAGSVGREEVHGSFYEQSKTICNRAMVHEVY